MLSEQMSNEIDGRKLSSATTTSSEVCECASHHILVLILLGAVNPRDSDLKISSDGDHIVFNGFKNFNTGGVVSDLTVLEGALDGSEAHIFAFAPTQQSGIQFAVSQLPN
jgi:hypothetical protein